MPLREPPLPLTLSFATASAASPAIKDAGAAGATILDQCLQLPKLNLGSCSARSSAARPKFLAFIEPLKPPFTARPPWCLALETYDKPRAVVLLDVYKDHEFLTTVRLLGLFERSGCTSLTCTCSLDSTLCTTRART